MIVGRDDVHESFGIDWSLVLQSKSSALRS
jgi:hypothetical protein